MDENIWQSLPAKSLRTVTFQRIGARRHPDLVYQLREVTRIFGMPSNARVWHRIWCAAHEFGKSDQVKYVDLTHMIGMPNVGGGVW